MKILNIGNVVTFSIQLYRHHFWQSFRLSLISYLWLFIPIYGWAKSVETLALISRLAWNHLGNQAEELPKAAKTLSRRTWTIFLSHLLVGTFNFLIAIAVILILSIVLIIGVIFIVIVLTATSNPASENIIYWLSSLYVFLGFLFMPLAMLWLYSRLFIFEAVLAIESEVTVWKSIRKSWYLTRKGLQQIQGVMAIIWILSILVFLIFWIACSLVAGIAINVLKLDEQAQMNLMQICFYVIYSLSIIFIQPIWQNTKAVLYFDFKNRKEGLDFLPFLPEFTQD